MTKNEVQLEAELKQARERIAELEAKQPTPCLQTEIGGPGERNGSEKTMG